MPFVIVRNDIANMAVDAIVNTANPQPVIGSGVDSAIHEKAGPGLLIARQKIGNIPVGSAELTAAYGLDAKYVIHTVGPFWDDGSHGEEALLRSCYDSCLKLALEHGCESIAFPLICAGNYGFPKDKALQIAIAAFSEFLLAQEMLIYLVVFDKDAFRLSENIFRNVTSYIDQHYVDQQARLTRPSRRRRDMALYEIRECSPCAPSSVKEAPSKADLQAFLRQKDAGFVETLLELIQKSGQKNATIYKNANISKQHFSKLINNPRASVTKSTAIALALALELDLAQTGDLIGRAGYTLTNSSIFDLIIQYHIENRIYNVVQINIVLYEFDQPLLGGSI